MYLTWPIAPGTALKVPEKMAASLSLQNAKELKEHFGRIWAELHYWSECPRFQASFMD